MEIINMGHCESIDGIQTCWTEKYPFIEFNAGKENSKRPKQSNDCTVIALAAVLDLQYDTAYDMLAKAGRKAGKGFHFREWAKIQENMEWESFQAVKGQKRMTISSFCEKHPKGRFIIRTAKHVAAVINGVVHASWVERPNRCVYACWRIN